MGLEESKAEYLREKAAGVQGAGERLLERHPEHFHALLKWLIEVTAADRAREQAERKTA